MPVHPDRPGVQQHEFQKIALERQLRRIAIDHEASLKKQPAPPKRPYVISRPGSLDATLLSLGVSRGEVYGAPPSDDVTDTDREEAQRERLAEQEESARRADAIPVVRDDIGP